MSFLEYMWKLESSSCVVGGDDLLCSATKIARTSAYVVDDLNDVV